MPRRVGQTVLAALAALSAATVALAGGPRDTCRTVRPTRMLRVPTEPARLATWLDRTSTAELVEVMRSPAIVEKPGVFERILRRPEIPAETRREALENSAASHGRDPVADLFRVAYSLDRSPTPDDAVLDELGRLLLTLDRKLLEKNWSSLRTLARYGRRAPTRRFGWAAYATGGAVARLQTDARGTRELPFLSGVPFVPDAKRRGELKPLVEEILARSTTRSPTERGTALAALVACDHSPATVERLLTEAKRELDAAPAAEEPDGFFGRQTGVTPAVLDALGRVPPDEFPADQAARYLALLQRFVEVRPLSPATIDSFRAHVSHATAVVERLGTAEQESLARTLDALDVPRLDVVAEWQADRFDRERIDVPAGRLVEVRLHNRDDVPQNLVVVKPGSVERVGESADAMQGPDVVERRYVPETDEVVAATTLAPPRGVASVVFRVPAEPGDYAFVCTVAERWRTMRGTLRVTEAPAE